MHIQIHIYIYISLSLSLSLSEYVSRTEFVCDIRDVSMYVMYIHVSGRTVTTIFVTQM